MVKKVKSNSRNKLTLKTKSSHTRVPEKLAELLANTYALYLKTQNFHWNVTGPTFCMLHTFFEDQYKELAAAIDVIAERIRALGEIAPGSFKEFAALSHIKDALSRKNSEEMIKELAADHHTLITLINTNLPLIEKFRDDVTQGLLIERLSAHEKTLWMLNSLLE